MGRAITSELKAVLEADGFVRRTPKEFVRVRDDLVDVVAFQMSQWGSKKFYVHYFCNLMATPCTERVIAGYRVGERLSNGADESIQWVADTRERAIEAMRSVAEAYRREVDPWFQRLGQVPNLLEIFEGATAG